MVNIYALRDADGQWLEIFTRGNDWDAVQYKHSYEQDHGVTVHDIEWFPPTKVAAKMAEGRRLGVPGAGREPSEAGA